MTRGKTLQLHQPEQQATTTAGKLKNKLFNLFE